jgi:hypothetical protein
VPKLTRGPAETHVEKFMSDGTGAKAAVRALLDRLPDDCNLESVIEEILLLEGPWCAEAELPPLTEPQRAALAESIAHHRQHPGASTPWREVLDRVGRRSLPESGAP